MDLGAFLLDVCFTESWMRWHGSGKNFVVQRIMCPQWAGLGQSIQRRNAECLLVMADKLWGKCIPHLFFKGFLLNDYLCSTLVLLIFQIYCY